MDSRVTCLTNLPTELIITILLHTDLRAVLSFSIAASRCLSIVQSADLWVRLLKGENALSRPQLQQMIIQLAEHRSIDILMRLCHLLERLNLTTKIDDYIWVLSLIHLQSPTTQEFSDLQRRIVSYRQSDLIDDPNYLADIMKTINGDAIIKYRRLVMDMNYNTTWCCISMVEPLSVLERATFRKRGKTIPTPENVISSLLESMGADVSLSSAEQVWYDVISFILPLIAEQNDLEAIDYYIEMIGAYIPLLSTIPGFPDPPKQIYGIIASYCNFETWNHLTHHHNFLAEAYSKMIVCKDLSVYKKICQPPYSGEEDAYDHIAVGYSCMEPEEWLQWLGGLKLNNEQRAHVIERALRLAKKNGYSYFVRVVDHTL